MIKKWIKLNTSFLDVLTSSGLPKNLEKKCSFENCTRNWSTYSNGLNSLPTTQIYRPISLRQPFSDRGDAASITSDSDDSSAAVVLSPAKTELFEVKGPKDSAFLIEVTANDLEEVKNDLNKIRGDLFHFDQTVIGWFTIKCILAVHSTQSHKNKIRLARIHAISSGCEEVYDSNGRLFFVNSVENTAKAKRILERFGYKVIGVLYRLQAREKVSMDDRIQELCNEFVISVKKLPKVISVTTNF